MLKWLPVRQVQKKKEKKKLKLHCAKPLKTKILKLFFSEALTDVTGYTHEYLKKDPAETAERGYTHA